MSPAALSARLLPPRSLGDSLSSTAWRGVGEGGGWGGRVGGGGGGREGGGGRFFFKCRRRSIGLVEFLIGVGFF